MSSQEQHLIQAPYDEDEIDLLDMLAFFLDHWKQLLIGTVVGGLIAGGGWAYWGKYQAELLLINVGELAKSTGQTDAVREAVRDAVREAVQDAAQPNEDEPDTSYLIDHRRWQSLSSGLPILAEEMLGAHIPAPNDTKLFEAMSKQTWWENNVTAIYLEEKVPGRKGRSTDTDTILRWKVTNQHRDQAEALKNVGVIAGFIKAGAAYLGARNYLIALEAGNVRGVANNRNSILKKENDLHYLLKRIQAYEALVKRFPEAGTNKVQQVVDIKTASAKYLSLNTQLVALNTEVIDLKESLAKDRDDLEHFVIQRHFLDKAATLTSESNYNGVLLLERLIELVDSLQRQLTESDHAKIAGLFDIHSALVDIKTGFSTGIDQSLEPTAAKKGWVLPVAAGLVAGFVLMLFLLMLKNATQKLRERRASAPPAAS